MGGGCVEGTLSYMTMWQANKPHINIGVGLEYMRGHRHQVGGMGMVNVGESQTSVSGDGLGVFSLGLYEFLGGQDMAIFRVT